MLYTYLVERFVAAVSVDFKVAKFESVESVRVNALRVTKLNIQLCNKQK